MPKILVADDNANIQKMVVLAFEERGIQVITAANGEAAVRRIPDLNPDLILADIFMPVRNGYEVCEFVKKDTRFSHIPVILLVGAFDPLDEKEARRVGADGVLKKPFVPPDPLIAMVMSALEKIPSVVAEFAKAKEAKEAPKPDPMPELAIPARPEPKPLPEFPEPSTPEEAAIAYGFGKNVRELNSESLAGHKAPIAEVDEDEEEEAGFNGASTSRDWRRDAMDFEVPSESANKPAFSSIEDFEPVKFPTEAEHPPRRVRARETEAPVERAEVEAVAAESSPVPAIAIPVAADESVPALEETPVQVAEAEPAAEVSEAAPELALEETRSEPVATAVLTNEAAPAIETVSSNQADVVAKTLPEPEADSLPDASEPANVPHWMDALSPSFQSPPAQRGWLDRLGEQSPATEAVSSLALESHDSVSPSAATIESVEAHAEASAEAIVEEAQPVAPAPMSDIDAPLAVEPPAYPAPVQQAPESSWSAPASDAGDRIEDPVSAPVAVAAAEPDRALVLDHSPHEPSLAFKDPNLVEPTAVRVTPEPLLVNDDAPHGPSKYGAQAQETSPLHSFSAPVPEESSVEEASAAREEVPAPTLEPSAVSPFSELDERIPTAPPPNRAALSEIPFLTPPPDFGAEIREAATGSDAVNVDDVVRKVLEKLEPQLHELLSRGLLKPLVENLLQSELAKKDK